MTSSVRFVAARLFLSIRSSKYPLMRSTVR
jgi:hypothetical protein